MRPRSHEMRWPKSEPWRDAGDAASAGKNGVRESAIKGAVVTRNRRIKKLAALVNTTPETLAEVIGDVLRETVNELQTYEPRAGARIARGIRGHQKMNPGA